MALKLKDGNTSNTNYEAGNSAQSGEPNPWDNMNIEGSMEPYHTTRSIKSTYAPEQENLHLVPRLFRLIGLLVVVGVLILAGKTIVAKLMPEGIDVTGLVNKPEIVLEKQLGITFEDNTSWPKGLLQYSGGKLTIRGDKDLGVVYINGQHAGLHIHTNQYKMFGIQVGMAEQKANETLTKTFHQDNFLTLIDEEGKQGTTTYYYYRTRENDCISIVIRNNTNRIDNITYYNNYKQLISHGDTF